MKGYLKLGDKCVKWSNLLEHKSIKVAYGKLTYVSPDLIGSLYLDESVICIGPNCFNNCSNLKQIILNDNLQIIGAYAFAGCRGLQQLNIPGSVTRIGDGITIGCTGLEKIVVDPSNPYYESEGNCVIANDVIIAGCKESSIRQHQGIGKHAFCGLSRDKWDIYNIENIESQAFFGCKLGDLLIITDPFTECTIAPEAFKSCSVGNATLSGDVQYEGEDLGGAPVMRAKQVMSVEFEGDIQQVAIFGGEEDE